MHLFRFALLASVSLFFSAAMAQEKALAGPVILTVTGLDPAVFPEGRAEFDLKALQALGDSQVTTGSIWTEGPHVFNGVMLRTLADHLHLGTPTLKLLALNDYAIAFPLADSTPDAPMLAYLM
ncbi:MAG: oxidoreductase, partial [Pseudorhodobacter sp.]|nr:oxidoreductase [Pseudorhodobacter sp.]